MSCAKPAHTYAVTAVTMEKHQRQAFVTTPFAFFVLERVAWFVFTPCCQGWLQAHHVNGVEGTRCWRCEQPLPLRYVEKQWKWEDAERQLATMLMLDPLTAQIELQPLLDVAQDLFAQLKPALR